MKTLRIRQATPADRRQMADWPSAGGVAPADEPDDLVLVAALPAPAEDDDHAGGPGGDGGRPLASVRLRTAIGLGLPRSWYHVGCTVHAARDLNLFHRQRTLLLGNDHTGASELANLVCAEGDVPLADRATALRLAVAAALMTVAMRRQCYAGTMIAELPGLRDGAGQSPFWAGLGRHFYNDDPAQAAALHGSAWRCHVAALLPRQPVYTSFLPPAAQAAIAQVHPGARLQQQVLEAAGLRYGHHVAIDDGGPVLEADMDSLPGVTRSRRWTVAAFPGDAPPQGALPCLLLQDRPDGSVAGGRAAAAPEGTRLRVAAAALAGLRLAEGDAVWAVPLQGDDA